MYTLMAQTNRDGRLFFQDFLSQNCVNNSCKIAISEETVEQFDY